ncbi:MAG TPA: phosphoribosylaminoimidazolesuccinocarboxamide synthase, partial [Paludibacteraceae bacterium]|nr:phosphoribosylaminoimidazolesuccinocarboxamide synthase [Paludibacteraceae bacterium]
ISDRYIELYEQITGEPFVRTDTENLEQRIEKNILDYLKNH